MAMVDVDGSSLPVDSQTNMFDLVWGLAAIWCRVCIHQVIQVNSHNGSEPWWQHHKYRHRHMYYYYKVNTHTHTFNGPFSRTTRVGRYQKGKTKLDFAEARDSEWQWHQLGHMQVCTSLQTDNHTSTSPLSFLQAGCPSCRPTNSVKALKANTIKWTSGDKQHTILLARCPSCHPTNNVIILIGNQSNDANRGISPTGILCLSTNFRGKGTSKSLFVC